MLTGRESLVRLVGKRRRFLPHRQSLISSPIQSSLNLLKKEGTDGLDLVLGGEGWREQRCKFGVEISGGNKIQSEASPINSHMNPCVARGTKRKFSQCTLLQLNFCSRSDVKVDSVESPDASATITQSDPGTNPFFVTNHRVNDSRGLEEYDSNHCEFPSNSEVVMPTFRVGSTENLVKNDRINCRVDLLSLVPENEMPTRDMDETVDDISELILETFIVGRRFGDEVELLNTGTNLFLLRDPDNVKDPNAVKVLSADCGCSKVLGFLPRELAQFLSPLMDKFCLTFEGYITSVPKRALAVVPIQIMCQNKMPYGEEDCDDLQLLKSLWNHALLVAKSGKNHVPSVSKYQQNFVVLIQEVLSSDPHLFTDEEKTFLGTFTSLLEDSQKLFVRLYTRKGPWFRRSNISYPEIFDCDQAIKELSVTGYLSSVESINVLEINDMKEVLNVLTVSELREIVCMLNEKCNRGTRKQDFIGLLLSAYENGLCPLLPSIVLNKTGVCVRVSVMAESLIWRAERLFFLNGEQDLSAFLLVDLGIVKYPLYNRIISDPIFSSQSDLLSYEEAVEVAQIMDEYLDENNSDLVIRCIEISDSRISSSLKAAHPSTSQSVFTFLSRFSASWVYSKVVLLGVSFLEHEQRYNDAINLLKRLLSNFTSDGRRGYWTLRLSIDLEHVDRIDESLRVAEGGLRDPWVRAGSRVALQRRVLRLGKPPRRWKIPSFSKSVKRKIAEVHVQGRPLNCKTGMKSRFDGEDGEQCGVEQLALQYYAGEGGGWHGVHTESGIWMTIFGLLMWDIIFSDVPNVFRTRFQTAPLDMETDDFYEARKRLIEPLLQKIKDGMGEEMLIISWDLHAGTVCRGINWDRHSLSELRAAVTCIGGPCLASVCQHLAQDYRSWSSGMPDLLLWRFHGDYRGEAKLVEVKGPRDRLSEQQLAWLLFLMDCGLNTEVCKVTPMLVSS